MTAGAPTVLWHFQFSHFNEKARWALDWKRVPHERRPVVPGFHMPVITALSGQRAVPVLELGGQVVTDSTAIIAALEAAVPQPPLYPSDPTSRAQALALEDLCDEALGPAVRRVVFHALLPDDAYCVRLLAEPLAEPERARFRDLFPMLREVMRSEMEIHDAGAQASRAEVAHLLDHLAGVRADRPFLVGKSFSVADLAAAALLSPLLAPPEFPHPYPRPWPADFEDLRLTFASHPTWHWATDLYRHHRGSWAEK